MNNCLLTGWPFEASASVIKDKPIEISGQKTKLGLDYVITADFSVKAALQDLEMFFYFGIRRKFTKGCICNLTFIHNVLMKMSQTEHRVIRSSITAGHREADVYTVFQISLTPLGKKMYNRTRHPFIVDNNRHLSNKM